MLEERLQIWDALTPEAQSQIQQSEWTIRWLTQLRSASASQRAIMTNDLPLPQREKLEEQVASWLALPDDHRIAQLLALRGGQAAVEQSVLRLVGGLPLEARLDLEALQLVAELDAGRTAREVLTDPAAGLPALRRLLELGLLVPAE